MGEGHNGWGVRSATPVGPQDCISLRSSSRILRSGQEHRGGARVYRVNDSGFRVQDLGFRV